MESSVLDNMMLTADRERLKKKIDEGSTSTRVKQSQKILVANRLARSKL